MKSTAKADMAAPSQRKILFGAPEGQDARILAERARALMPQDRVLIHVALDEERLAVLQDLLAFFAPDVRVASFPAWDCLPYDRVSPHGDISAARVAALTTLLGWQKERERHPRILLTTVNAALQRVMPRGALENAALLVRKGGRLDSQQLQSFLAANGYLKTDTVREAGEYALRGGIADLFPPGREEPIRIDLFGDEVESIRGFDPSTQRTEGELKEFSLIPATEFFLDEASVARFRAGYRQLFGAVRDDDPLYEAVSAGRRHAGMEHWQPLFFEHMDTLFDYAPGAEIVLDRHADQARAERQTQVHDFYQARKSLEDAGKKKKSDISLSGAAYRPLPAEKLYLSESEWDRLSVEAEQLSPFGAPHDAPLKAFPPPGGRLDGGDAPQQPKSDYSARSDHPPIQPSPRRGEGFSILDGGGRRGRDFGDLRAQKDADVLKAVAEYAAAQRKEKRKVLIAAYSEGARERLRVMLEQAGFANFKPVDGADDLKKLEPQQTGLSILALEHGFTAPDLAVLTEQDILGDRLARRKKKRKKSDNFLTEVSSLAPGDLVVHIDHGVGRFEGLETLRAAGTVHDCLKITYANDDRLFVPVENIEVLSRFGNAEGMVHLDKLGGASWQARKAKVKKDLMVMADGLLKIAAERALKQGEVLPAEGAYHEFAAKFPWQETDDQQRSIDDVLGDLASGQPMDRLVCGDVGFGKTEVALRAAYVAAMHGAQVAVAVPTTLLARQHYQNFTARFAGTGLRVEQLSRLVTAKDAARAKDGIADGSVNIVIGTHALFGKGVKFRHLGLMIVDEEQRFGVKQKERLKEMKANVHVLTLTATPIPRTLQMALTGVRDMSLIATPPIDRLAVRTAILPFDPVVVREAILREHYRGGQSFYVCPRVEDIHKVEEILKELVPEVKVLVAHGQLSATDLEDRMSAFYEGHYDVLLATTIIESGLDIPRANTLIVHRADMFGLAQLYQIRGRIGRAKIRAYAYLTYEANKALTPQAQKRLEVMETLDTLGAGFQLASHDMDIRGAGNLLGEEQSGHIKEVGVELYQQMLEEAVAAAREGVDFDAGEKAAGHWSPQINLGTSVLIPEVYVEDLTVRMSLYRRLTDLHEKQDIEAFAAELIDRFGKLPPEVENLLQIIEIKQLCKQAGIERLDGGPKGAVIQFHNNAPPNVAGLMKWLQGKPGVRLRPDQKLVVERVWDQAGQRTAGARSLMRELAVIGAK